MRFVIVASVLLLALVVSRQPAQAQIESREAIALQNQILQLQQQVQALQNRTAQGGGAPTNLARGASPSQASSSNDLVATLLSRVDALEEQVRQLRGRIDETENRLQRQGAELGKRIDDMAFQTQNPPGAGAPPGTSGPPAGTSPAPTPLSGAPAAGVPGQPGAPSATVHRTPEIALQEGNAALARRDYAAAEQTAREVLTGNRTSPRAYDAQFLLAQALAGQRQYSQAAIAYDDSYNRSRKGVHAADSLVGLSSALAAINEKKAACDTLVKLKAEFPNPRPDLHDVAVAIGQRAGCK